MSLDRGQAASVEPSTALARRTELRSSDRSALAREDCRRHVARVFLRKSIAITGGQLLLVCGVLMALGWELCPWPSRSLANFFRCTITAKRRRRRRGAAALTTKTLPSLVEPEDERSNTPSCATGAGRTRLRENETELGAASQKI